MNKIYDLFVSGGRNLVTSTLIAVEKINEGGEYRWLVRELGR